MRKRRGALSARIVSRLQNPVNKSPLGPLFQRRVKDLLKKGIEGDLRLFEIVKMNFRDRILAQSDEAASELARKTLFGARRVLFGTPHSLGWHRSIFARIKEC